MARLNVRIMSEDWGRDWPEPYLLPKLIRCFAYPTKKCWLVTKKILSNLGRFLRKHACTSFHRGHTDGDIESIGTDDEDAPEETSPIGKAKSEFRRSLRKMFSDAACVDEIMFNVETWGDERLGPQMSITAAYSLT